MRVKLAKKIKYWKDKYKDMPNGYFVSLMIGEQYVSDASRISPSRRKKLKKEKLWNVGIVTKN